MLCAAAAATRVTFSAPSPKIDKDHYRQKNDFQASEVGASSDKVFIVRTSANETKRLNALLGFEILDTEPEEAFDVLTKLAASLCGMPIAIISLVDGHRQWFKSQCGLDNLKSTRRDASFCTHAILQTTIFEVSDARADPRFADNPLVNGEPHIRLDAGVPLFAKPGIGLGPLCVIDRKPGKLTQEQRLHLQQLAKVVEGLIATRIRRSELNEYRLAKQHRAALATVTPARFLDSGSGPSSR